MEDHCKPFPLCCTRGFDLKLLATVSKDPVFNYKYCTYPLLA